MRINPYKGLFIDIEGLDGSGSDGIARQIARRLKRQGLPVLSAKEPTRGPIGRFTRRLIRKKEELSPVLLEFLFAADRALQLEEIVTPALKSGEIVVSDRALWSSIAYRSLDFPIHWLLEVNREFIIPDITYFIDVSPAKCAAIIKKGQDEIQLYIEEGKLSSVRAGFQWIYQKFPHWFIFINGEQEKEKILTEVLSLISRQEKFKALKKLK